MAGSHRAQSSRRPRSSSVPRWAVVVAIVVALIPATYLTAHRVLGGSSATPSDHSTDLPIPPVTPSGTPTASATPTSTPSSTPSTPAKSLPRVAPDAPRRLVAGRLVDTGFDASVTDLDATSASEVARWDPRGSPGSPGTDTVFVIGRVYAGKDSAFAELPGLRRGATVSIRTDRGTMTYTVDATALKPEAGLRRDPTFTQHQPGRLVLVGIRYDASGDRLDKALVVTAQLSAAKPS